MQHPWVKVVWLDSHEKQKTYFGLLLIQLFALFGQIKKQSSGLSFLLVIGTFSNLCPQWTISLQRVSMFVAK